MSRTIKTAAEHIADMTRQESQKQRERKPWGGWYPTRTQRPDERERLQVVTLFPTSLVRWERRVWFMAPGSDGDPEWDCLFESGPAFEPAFHELFEAIGNESDKRLEMLLTPPENKGLPSS